MNDKTIAELREWKRNHYDSDRLECGSKAFDEILSHAVPVKEVEPLAVQGPTPKYLKAQKLLWDEAIKEHQKLYQENQRLQCEIERLSKDK